MGSGFSFPSLKPPSQLGPMVGFTALTPAQNRPGPVSPQHNQSPSIAPVGQAQTPYPSIPSQQQQSALPQADHLAKTSAAPPGLLLSKRYPGMHPSIRAAVTPQQPSASHPTPNAGPHSIAVQQATLKLSGSSLVTQPPQNTRIGQGVQTPQASGHIQQGGHVSSHMQPAMMPMQGHYMGMQGAPNFGQRVQQYHAGAIPQAFANANMPPAAFNKVRPGFMQSLSNMMAKFFGSSKPTQHAQPMRQQVMSQQSQFAQPMFFAPQPQVMQRPQMMQAMPSGHQYQTMQQPQTAAPMASVPQPQVMQRPPSVEQPKAAQAATQAQQPQATSQVQKSQSKPAININIAFDDTVPLETLRGELDKSKEMLSAFTQLRESEAKARIQALDKLNAYRDRAKKNPNEPNIQKKIDAQRALLKQQEMKLDEMELHFHNLRFAEGKLGVGYAMRMRESIPEMADHWEMKRGAYNAQITDALTGKGLVVQEAKLRKLDGDLLDVRKRTNEAREEILSMATFSDEHRQLLRDEISEKERKESSKLNKQILETSGLIAQLTECRMKYQMSSN